MKNESSIIELICPHSFLLAQMRSIWYQVMVAQQDEEVQKKGVIGIMYSPKTTDDANSRVDGENFLKMGAITAALPMHMAGKF
jgi:competence transcription factor ComK